MLRDAETNQISDRIRYEHIRDAARDVVQMTSGRVRADMDTDVLLRRATIHAIQEIGEAAARVSDAGRLLVPEIPWGSIVQMRNIVVHVYWGVNLDRVWQVGIGGSGKEVIARSASATNQKSIGLDQDYG